MDTTKLNKNIQRTTIKVPFYINSSGILDVIILAKSEHTRLFVILCEISDNVYQDFYLNTFEGLYKPIAEYGDRFGTWWDEEDVSELNEMPIFKDFKNKIANFKYS